MFITEGLIPSLALALALALAYSAAHLFTHPSPMGFDSLKVDMVCVTTGVESSPEGAAVHVAHVHSSPEGTGGSGTGCSKAGAECVGGGSADGAEDGGEGRRTDGEDGDGGKVNDAEGPLWHLGQGCSRCGGGYGIW